MSINIDENDVVLFVDDEENVLKSIERSLIDENFTIITTSSPKKAIEIMKNEHVSVLVTDLRMPEMSGIDLIRLIDETHPDITKVVLTGYYQVSTILSAIQSGQVYHYLTKPWKFESEFLPVIKKAILHYKDMEIKNHLQNTLELEVTQLKKMLNTHMKENHQLTNNNRIQETLLISFMDSLKGYVKQIHNTVGKLESNEIICDTELVIAIRNMGLEIIKDMQAVIKQTDQEIK